MSHCMSYSLAAGHVAVAHIFFRLYDPAKHCIQESSMPRQVQWNWEPGIWMPEFNLQRVSSYLELDTYTWSGLYHGVLCWTRLFCPEIFTRWYDELQLLFSRALCFICYQVDRWKIGQLAQSGTQHPMRGWPTAFHAWKCASYGYHVRATLNESHLELVAT